MQVSSVGASQSLDLVSLLAARRRATSTGTSSDATTDTLTLSLQAQVLALPAGANSFQTDFDALGTALQSGDLDAAKKAYATMQDKFKAHQPPSGGDDPMGSAFAAIGKALDAGDTGTAQSAWSSLKTQFASMGGSGGTNPFEQDLNALGKLIDAGNLDGAKSLFKTMQSRMQAHRASTQEPSTQDGADGASAFSALGSALQSSDLSSAQEAWQSLIQQLQNRNSAT
jgi:soluble cytochrome b562